MSRLLLFKYFIAYIIYSVLSLSGVISAYVQTLNPIAIITNRDSNIKNKIHEFDSFNLTFEEVEFYRKMGRCEDIFNYNPKTGMNDELLIEYVTHSNWNKKLDKYKNSKFKSLLFVVYSNESIYGTNLTLRRSKDISLIFKKMGHLFNNSVKILACENNKKLWDLLQIYGPPSVAMYGRGDVLKGEDVNDLSKPFKLIDIMHQGPSEPNNEIYEWYKFFRDVWIPKNITKPNGTDVERFNNDTGSTIKRY